MALSPHRKQHPQTTLQVAVKVWSWTTGGEDETLGGDETPVGEDMASDGDKTLGCGDRTLCCTYKEVEVECVPMMVDGNTGGEGGRSDVP